MVIQRLLALLDRRAFAVLCALAVCCAAGETVSAAGKTHHPNILLIITDQQHANMMSCAGNPWVKTPAMDSLANSGARFQRAYSVNPVCVPSRVGMFTGCTPSRFGMQDNKELKTTIIPPEIQKQTMGWLLRSAGYETMYGGKVHLPGKAEDYGFDVLTADERDELAARCVDFLNKKHDKPFLLVASFINPHDICYMAINAYAKAQGSTKVSGGVAYNCLLEASKTPKGISEADFFMKYCPPVPVNLEPQAAAPEAIGIACCKDFRAYALKNWSEKDWRLHRWAYVRLTEKVDGQIETVLQALRKNGLEENTAVIFTSDHGDHDGSHRLEHKSTFFEEAANVPFIVSQKGSTRAGLVDKDHLVSSGMDLIPTLCDYAGILIPAHLKGRSVRALAEGQAVAQWRPYVISETHYGRMVCSGRYKYCVYRLGPADHREQLVDLQKDPGEMQNLAGHADCRGILEEHRGYMSQWISTNDDTLALPYVITK